MRSALKTIRLNPDEAVWVKEFLERNPALGSFSDLARLALIDFIQRQGNLLIAPVAIRPSTKEKPSFIWDYDLDKQAIVALLKTQPLEKKKWLIARILEHATFEEVWEYLTPMEIHQALPELRMDEKKKKHWEFALNEWSRK